MEKTSSTYAHTQRDGETERRREKAEPTHGERRDKRTRTSIHVIHTTHMKGRAAHRILSIHRYTYGDADERKKKEEERRRRHRHKKRTRVEQFESARKIFDRQGLAQRDSGNIQIHSYRETFGEGRGESDKTRTQSDAHAKRQRNNTYRNPMPRQPGWGGSYQREEEEERKRGRIGLQDCL